jgi:hypothetical protein
MVANQEVQPGDLLVVVHLIEGPTLPGFDILAHRIGDLTDEWG